MKLISLIAVILSMIFCLLTACSSSDKDNASKSDETSPPNALLRDDNADVNYDQSNNENGDVTMANLDKYKETGHPIAVIEMNDGGQIIVELYDDIAPNTVNSFISLANKGFYDGLIFHRVIQGFMIQGGDPNGNGTGGPGYCIPGEFRNNNFNNTISHTRGTISMERRGSQFADYMYYNTAGCQFFICDADSTFLDGNYASFGKVVEGMDVVDKIAATKTGPADRPLEDQVMKTVRVETFGKTYDEPVTLPEA